MSKLSLGSKLILLFVFCTGIKGQEDTVDDCWKIINYEGGVETFLVLADKDQLNVTCAKMRRFFGCVNDLARERVGFDVRTMAILARGTDIKSFQLLVNVMDLTEELCTEGTQLRKDYLMDVHCVRNLREDARLKCKRESIGAFVMFGIFRRLSTDTFDGTTDILCIVKAYQAGCLGANILEQCGDRALNTYKEIVQKINFFKMGICPADTLQYVNTTITNIFENLESRKTVYHAIMALKKRRK